MNFDPNNIVLLKDTNSKELRHLNVEVLDYLLQHQELIPSEWKKLRIWFYGEISKQGAFKWPCVRTLYWCGTEFVATHNGVDNRKYNLDYIPYYKEDRSA